MCSNKSFAEPEVPSVTNFSLEGLKKLVDHENSCVSCVSQCIRSIDLMPLHLKDLKSSIKELLRSKVTKYDVELQGIILAHKNVKVNASSVQLSDEITFPLEYRADIYVFKPQIGSTLTGIVNKIANNAERITYVSVLVHNTFNVIVYSEDQPKWCQTVAIGSEVTVKVVSINYTGRMPFIKATIFSPISEWDEKDGTDGSKKSKKQKKKKRKDSETDGAILQRPELFSILKNSPYRMSGQSSTELESHESSSTESSKAQKSELTSPSQKKKKKKDRELSDGPPFTVNEAKVDPASKKRKRNMEDSSDSAAPSKKKKKKDQTKDEFSRDGPPPKTEEVQSKRRGKKNSNEDCSSSIDTDSHASAGKKKKKVKETRSTSDITEELMKQALQQIKPAIELNESILKAASNRTHLSQPASMSPPKKKKKTKFDEVAKINPGPETPKERLIKSTGHVKKQLTSPTETSSTDGPQPETENTRSKRRKNGYSNNESGSSIDAGNQASVGKKKKKKVKETRSMNDITDALMKQALEQIKSEI